MQPASDACWSAATYRVEAFAKPQGVQRQFEAIGASVLVERAVAALMKMFLKAGNRSSAGGVGSGNRHKGLIWEGDETGPGESSTIAEQFRVTGGGGETKSSDEAEGRVR